MEVWKYGSMKVENASRLPDFHTSILVLSVIWQVRPQFFSTLSQYLSYCSRKKNEYILVPQMHLPSLMKHGLYSTNTYKDHWSYLFYFRHPLFRSNKKCRGKYKKR